MIVIIDYGMGNLGSIANMLKKAGGASTRSLPTAAAGAPALTRSSLRYRWSNGGAGELLLNSIDRDGTMQGYDLELIRRVSGAVNIPVVACGGAGTIQDIAAAVNKGGASAAAAGSLLVFQGPHRAVLISCPSLAGLCAVFQDIRGGVT